MQENQINQIKIQRKIKEVEKQIAQTIALQHQPKWDIQTISSLKAEKQQNKNDLIIKLIKAYNNAHEQKLRPTIKTFAHASKVHSVTFSKKLHYYNKYGMLPIHKNTSKKQRNIIKPKIVKEFIKKIQNILDVNYKFAKVDVPMTMPVFKTFIEMEYSKEGKKFPFSNAAFYNLLGKNFETLFLKYSNKLNRKLRKRLLRLQAQLKSLKGLIIKTSMTLDAEATKKAIRSDKSSSTLVVPKIQQISKRRMMSRLVKSFN